MVSFGKKATRSEIERSETEVVNTGLSIWNFRDGSTTVRFLEELSDEEWTTYWEHYDQGKKKFYPCPGKDVCPGCKEDLRAQKRYLVNALVVASDNSKVKAGYVNLYKVPASLIDKFMRRADRAGGTITDRDYEIIRTGSGLDTEYDLETGDKSKIDISQYEEKMIDHEEALQAAWNAAFPDAAEEPKAKYEIVVDETPAPRRRVKTAQEVEDEAKPTVKERVAARSGKSDLEAAAAGEDPPSEPQSQSESADAEDEVISEEALREMSEDDLHDIYTRAGLEYDDDWAVDELVDNLIEQLAED